MATYPDDATADATEFSVLSTITYSSTGSTTDFNLSGEVSSKAEVLAIVDGVVQDTVSYSLTNASSTVSFSTAPNATTLVLKNLDLPSRFLINRKLEQTGSVFYSNSSATVVDSNTYLINANTEAFALPVTSSPTDANTILVFLSGILQDPSTFTFPSRILGNRGIDIGDNSAVKLLTLFNNNLTDSSPVGHTMTMVGAGSATFANEKQITLDGTNDYVFTEDLNKTLNIFKNDFTIDVFAKPDTGTSMSSNQSLFAYHSTASQFVNLQITGANSNVGFIINDSGTTTEIYGGNCNGGVNVHIATSYEKATSNLRLYVNNVKVAHTTFSTFNDFDGNVTIGANSHTGTGKIPGEFFNGNIDFVRVAASSRYKTAEHMHVTDHDPSIISGAPLGSLNTDDKLDIRVFEGTVETDDRFSSMADKKPDAGFSLKRAFDTILFESQAGYEKRRLRSRRSKRTFELQYTNLHGVGKKAIDNFYTARSGNFDSFLFDLSHISESGTATVRFDGDLNIQQVLSASSNLRDNFFTVSFTLKEVFD